MHMLSPDATLTEAFAESIGDPQAYMQHHFSRTAAIIQALDGEAVATLADWVLEAGREDRTVFTLGNGGSATVAGAWANDLAVNTVCEGQPGFRVMALGDSGPCITAAGNDAAFKDIFVLQLRAAARPGDLVIGMSCSGNSPNVLRALAHAREIGARTVSITGFSGGTMRGQADLSIHIPSQPDDYGPVEDAFSAIMHAVTAYITMARGKALVHPPRP